jgi:hypothetical protein
MTFFKIFRIMGVLSSWMEKSLMDGVLDRDEIIELITTIMDILGVKAEIKIDMQ